MKTQIDIEKFLIVLLLLTELVSAASFIHEANFHRAFDGKDYYTTSNGTKVDLNPILSTMSSDGKVVAFYGNTYFDGINHIKLFIPI